MASSLASISRHDILPLCTTSSHLQRFQNLIFDKNFDFKLLRIALKVGLGLGLFRLQEMGKLGTRSTALAEGEGGEGSASEPARFKAAEDKTVRAAIDHSGGTRVGSGGSGGELVRSFVELVKTFEAKVSVGMNFGDLDTCVSRLRGSESVGELESGLGDERKVVSIGSKTNSDANLGDGENGNSFVDTMTYSGVNQGDEENGNSFDDTKINSGVNNGVEENGKSLDEIGQDLGGKTELIEVPIAGTSENSEDWVGEELGDQVYEFSVGDFVWGKIKNHPWWPGQICDPSDASEYAAKLKSKDKLLVAYFGDGTFAWCHPSQLKPFEENFVEISKLSSSKVFVIAVQQAVDEIGRLVKLKMSCTCMGEEFLSSLNGPLASNAGIKDGAVVSGGRVGKLLGLLSQPADLLAELKRIAQVVSLTSVLELNVLKSLLSAFYCSKGGYQLPVYLEPHLIPGLEDDRKVVEVPVQWPFEGWRSSPLGFNTGNADQSLLQRSPPSIENRQPRRMKVKSIADLLGGADGVQSKSVDGVIAKEGAISEKQGLSSRRKKQESRDNHGVGILTSESGKERAKLSKSPISTHINKIWSVDNECSGRKEETKKGPLSRRRKRDEYIGIDSNDGDTQEKTGGKEETKKALSSRRRKKDEGVQINSNDGEAKGKTGDNPISRVGELPNVGLQNDMKDQIDKSPSSRERKKSKYLSPPFTRSDIKRRRNPETESPNAVTSHHDIGKEGKEGDMELVSLEVSNKSPSSRERKKSKYLSPPFTRSDMGKRRRNPGTESPNAVTSHHDMGEEGKEGDMELVSLEVSNKSPSSRERKKSKYLSPPFTRSDMGKRRRNLETESPNAVTSHHDMGKEGKERGMELVSLGVSNKNPSSRERKKSKYLCPPFTRSDMGKRRRNLETESPNAVTSHHDMGKEGDMELVSPEVSYKSPSSRERKKSKYLSPPFTRSDMGKRRRNLETESPNTVTSHHDMGKEGKEGDMELVSLEVSNKSPSSRERKKSKYLSSPFTRSDMGKRRRNLETESPSAVTSHHDMGKEGKERDMELVSLEVSNKAQFGERMTRAAANRKESPQILNCCSEALQEKPSTEGENNNIDPKTMHATSRGSGSKTPAEGEKKHIDPMKANVAANEVLSGVRSAAVGAFHPVERKSSFEIVVDFTSIFRDSVYRNGSNYKRYKNHESHGKRKKSDSEPGSLGKDNQTAANLSEGESGKRNTKKYQEMKYDKQKKKQAAETPRSKRKKLDSAIKSLGKDNQNAENMPVTESGKRNSNKNQAKPTKKTAAEPPISKLVRRRSKHAETQDLKIKETGEETSHTSLFVTFGPGSSLPTKDDLHKLYSKFGELNETETETFYTNFCARIAFVRSSDAEEAFNHSLIDSPFGPSNVNFRLQNPAGAAKTRELSAIPKSPPAKRSMGETAGEALVAAGEASQLDLIRHKLEMMSSMLGSSDRKVLPVTKSKLQNEIKELLKTVSTMVDTSS